MPNANSEHTIRPQVVRWIVTAGLPLGRALVVVVSPSMSTAANVGLVREAAALPVVVTIREHFHVPE